MRTLLTIGTGKGLFLARGDDRGSWEVSGPHFTMNGIYAVAIDSRRTTPRLLAGVTSSHFGPSVAISDDLGASWREPQQAPVAFPERTGRALDRVWQIAPGPEEQPERVYAGSQPAALFVSDDGGLTYRMVEPLWDHPHRENWGAGFGGQAIHTVLPHPTEPDSLLVAMSTGGVYRSLDGGATWTASNAGIRAHFLPDPWPEYGQCVHKVARDAVDPDRLYAQNHFGVYRSDDGGESWQSIADGLPSDFGFPMVAHPSRSGVIYNFPLQADGERFPPGKRCAVYRSADAGKSWEELTAGLPTEPFYPSVLRDAMCARRRSGRGLLRYPLGRGLRQPRRRRLLVPGRGAPARRTDTARGPVVNRATVILPGLLRDETGGAGRLDVSAGGTLGAVLDEVAERWPRLERRIRDERGELRRYVNVYVNGEECRRLSGQATTVPAGAEIQVLPSVAGG